MQQLERGARRPAGRPAAAGGRAPGPPPPSVSRRGPAANGAAPRRGGGGCEGQLRSSRPRQPPTAPSGTPQRAAGAAGRLTLLRGRSRPAAAESSRRPWPRGVRVMAKGREEGSSTLSHRAIRKGHLGCPQVETPFTGGVGKRSPVSQVQTRLGAGSRPVCPPALSEQQQSSLYLIAGEEQQGIQISDWHDHTFSSKKQDCVSVQCQTLGLVKSFPTGLAKAEH